MKKKSIDTKQVTEAAVSHFHSIYRTGKIGHLLIDALLSQGAIHDCYRVFDPRRSKTLFLKILNQKQGALPSSLASLEKEAKILASLSHPCLVEYVEHGSFEGRLGLLCEYYDSITLRHFLEEENPSIDEAFSLLEQIAGVLSYLHQNEIIHSDLKPENILVLPSGEIRLVDLGIAQFINSQVVKKVKRLAGTLLYMSPEQHEQEGKLSYSSDLYSLAIIAFELVTGRLSHGVVKLTALPAVLQKTFAKALHPDPTKRFDSALSFLDALKAHRKAFSSKISAQIRPITLTKGLLDPPLFQADAPSNQGASKAISFTIPPHFWPMSALWLTKKNSKSGQSYALLVESASTCPDSYIALHRHYCFFQNILAQLSEKSLSEAQALSQLKEPCAFLTESSHFLTKESESTNTTGTTACSFLLVIDSHWKNISFYPISGTTRSFMRARQLGTISEQALSQDSLKANPAEDNSACFQFSLEEQEAIWFFTSHLSQSNTDMQWLRSCLSQEGFRSQEFALRLAREASERASKELSILPGASMQRTPKKVGVCTLQS